MSVLNHSIIVDHSHIKKFTRIVIQFACVWLYGSLIFLDAKNEI